MTRTWLIDVRGFAVKVKNPTCSSSHITNSANRECPNCHHQIDNRDVSIEWPGLPAGVKFDPSDAEILEHLAAKCGVRNLEPHVFINEFIPTVEGDQGICYTHPENLPGTKKDGSSAHFFHRTTNAYATGQRKRRKIQSQCALTTEHVRWHKTGKTKHVVENGVQKGCKKIMVLYKSSNKGSKPEKSNWVMHQYHLGTEEDEKDGEYVVSKIFYQQQKQTEENACNPVIEDPDILALRTSPTTPKTNPPNPPRPSDDDMSPISAQESKSVSEELHAAPAVQLGDDRECTGWLAGESQNVDEYHLDCGNDSLLCNEILDPSNNSAFNVSSNSNVGNSNDQSLENKPYGVAELANLELDTPPDFLAELQFDSQDSILGWLDRL